MERCADLAAKPARVAPPPHPTYSIPAVIRAALDEDVGDVGDVSSLSTIPATTRSTATLLAKASGILAGEHLGNAVLAAGSHSKYQPYATAVGRILDGEAEHQRVTAAMLKEVCADDSKATAQAQRYLTSWLRASLSELAGDTVALFAEAKSCGLLPADAEEIRNDLITRLAPEIKRTGLKPPSISDLHLEE